jgi:alpha-L-fucosidase
LLNVGPTARGDFDYRVNQALESIGKWMGHNNRSIYGCTQAPEGIEAPENSLLTYNPKTNRLYVHLLDYPLQNFTLPGYKDKVKYAQFLHDGSEIKITERHGFGTKEAVNENDLNLSLPVNKPDYEIPVIEVFLN